MIKPYSWLIPLGLSIYLLVWIVLPLIRKQDDPVYIASLRAGGGIPLSACIWLIWWLI